MRKSRWTALALVVLAVLALLPGVAAAAPPSGDEYPVFICPALNTHNPHGTWVVGAHGAYYVNIVVRGQETDPAPGVQNKVFVKVDEDSRAVAKAQIPAGFALYKDVFPEAFSDPDHHGYDTKTAGNAPNALVPMQFVVLLGEGIDNWIAPFGDTNGWDEFDPATVMPTDTAGVYRVTDLRLMKMGAANATITIKSPIPLAAGVFW